MNKKRNSLLGGINASLSIDPSAASSATASPNITNHIIIREVPNSLSQNDLVLHNLEPNEEVNEEEEIQEKTVKPKKEKIYAREVIIKTEGQNNNTQPETKPLTAEQEILYTYAKILLDQNKVLFTNLISKNSIIVPKDRLEAIIKAAVGKPCEITLEEDTSCCIAKYSPIKKIESIKIINEDLVIDFKQVYNSIYNELNSKYFLNLKYAVEV